MRRFFFLKIGALASAFLTFPAFAFAQGKDEFRAQARTHAAQLRSLGEPKDRCSIGASFENGGTVVDVFRATTLNEGDRIINLNGTDVSSMSTEQVVALLRNIAPDVQIPVTVRRGQESLSLQVSCSNARPATEVILAGLDQAGRGRWNECAQTFGSRNDLSFYGASMRLACASYSRSPEGHNVGELALNVARMAIDVGRWLPSRRQDVVRQLRALEYTITQSHGSSGFQQLVDLTRRWEGDENLWDRSEPDWAQFRRNAEAALRGRLIDPESARIEWPYGFLLGSWRPLLGSRVEGYWTCGLINARNRMGGYTGATSFVVVLSPEGQVRYSDVGTARDYDFLSSQCSRSVNLLPPPQQAMISGSDPQQTASPPLSLAGELERLVQLRDSGAITQAEFEAAKARLLAPPNE